MDVYTVTKEGVYRHETMGCYATEAEARARAEDCVMQDEDSYHSYAVNRLTVGGKDESTIDSAQGVGADGKPWARYVKAVGFRWMGDTP